MKFDLAIAEGAHGDIIRNAVWWAEHHSYGQAIRWQDAIYEQLESLREKPDRCPLAPEDSKFPYDLREKLVGLNRRGYRAVFTIRERTVYVLAIRRTAQSAVQPSDLKFDPET